VLTSSVLFKTFLIFNEQEELVAILDVGQYHREQFMKRTTQSVTSKINPIYTSASGENKT
jgi:hypothetical protein